jgi:multiple sugar transport system ATP-binding protein
VITTELLGSELLAYFEIAAAPVATAEVREVREDTDRSRVSELEAEAKANRAVLVGRFDVASRARAGSTIDVHVDTSKLHFFDLDSEAAIGDASQPRAGEVAAAGSRAR